MTASVPRPSQHHRRVRRQHSDELAQDYVEAIYHHLQEAESIRVTDLQEVFGVSHVSVIRALQRIEAQELLVYSKDKGIYLTEKGKQMAKKAADRHALLVQLLIQLGVSEPQAKADAEGAEHHLSEETCEAIRTFIGRSE